MHVCLTFDGTTAGCSGQRTARLGHAVAGGGIHGGWEVDGDGLQAWTDPLGFQAVFYASDNRRCIVSDSLLEVIAAGAPAEWNLRALGVFLRVGWFLGEDTPFRQVSVLPPGGRLGWRRGTMALDQQPVTARTDGSLTRQASIDRFIDLFREAIALTLRSLDGEILLPLSGGRDSRHILAELTRQGAQGVGCVTYNYNPGGLDDEARCAMEVASRLGQPHRLLAGRRQGAGDRLRAMSITHLCADEHQKMLVLRDDPALPQHTLLDGLGGDVLSRNKGFVNETIERCTAVGDWRGMALDLTEGFQRVVGHPVEQALEQRGLAQRMPRDQAVEDLTDSLSGHADFSDPYRAFMFFTRTRREIALAPAAILSRARRVLCPYLHPPLLNMLLSMPLEVASRGGLHDDAIAQAYPTLAGVAYADGQGIRWGSTPWSDHASKVRRALAADWRLGTGWWLRGLVREARYLRERRNAPTEWLDSYLVALSTGSTASGARKLLALRDAASRAPEMSLRTDSST
jgi:asparagine synthase (glutamine-hydrolysing)